MIPIRTDAPLRRTPTLNWALITINLLAYIAQQTIDGLTDRLMLSPTDPKLYHFITYQFMHGSPLHVISNMLFLFIFGSSVQDKMGRGNYLLFYLAGGIVAGCAHVLGSDNPVIGASGSVAAVTGAYMILFPRARVTVLYFFIIIGLFEVPGFVFVLVFFMLDVFKQFAPGLFGDDRAVAHLAHIGGTLFGVLIASLLLYARLLPRDQFDAVALIQRWNRRRQYRDVVASGYNPFGYSAPQRVRPPDAREQQIMDLRAQVSEAIAHNKLSDAARYYEQLVAMDPRQVLARQSQLDVANQLFAEDRHESAAGAYEAFLGQYPKAEQTAQVQLMLGLLYARYLRDPGRARFHLETVLPKLHDAHEIEVARDELSRLPAKV